MDNRNISGIPTQLSLNFGAGGGGHNGLFRHGKNSSASFNDVISVEALFAAWAKFCKGKRSRLDILQYERHVEENIFELHHKLVTGQYQHGAYEPFIICDPKQRLIHKATVGDRLIHQAIVSAIEPSFERQFIYDSYSCRKGKGTHAGVARLQRFLRSASHNNSQTVYALKCDVKQFFASMNHDILRSLIKVYVQDVQVLGLLDAVIDSLSTAPGKGIPLGNITSQLFANIYLHELDWYVKQTLKVPHYLRYCDDFIIVSRDRDYLLNLIPQLTLFLKDKLLLQLHPDKIDLRSWNQGIDFLGYVVKPTATLLRHKTKKRMLRKVDQANATSYLGVCAHADTYELSQLLCCVVVRYKRKQAGQLYPVSASCVS